MTVLPQTSEQRKIRSIARRYERDGYCVTRPSRGDPAPLFLEGLLPDLIAESEADRVVVLVKPSRTIRGSNDLEDFAERVARSPGWRLELVAIGVDQPESWPMPNHFEALSDRVHQAFRAGLSDIAYVYAVQALERLVADLANRNRLTLKDVSTPLLLHRLTFLGLISSDTFDALRRALSTRDQLMMETTPPILDLNAMTSVLAIGERLQAEMQTRIAA